MHASLQGSQERLVCKNPGSQSAAIQTPGRIEHLPSDQIHHFRQQLRVSVIKLFGGPVTIIRRNAQGLKGFHDNGLAAADTAGTEDHTRIHWASTSMHSTRSGRRRHV